MEGMKSGVETSAVPGDPASDSALLTTKVRDKERGTGEQGGREGKIKGKEGKDQRKSWGRKYDLHQIPSRIKRVIICIVCVYIM